MIVNFKPIIETINGIRVVRDDLFPGGTKARFMPAIFEDCEELVYGSPAEGGAQTAMAWTAKQLGKKATIFVAKRAKPHPRALMAKALGAKVMQISPGYLTVVQARAAAYAKMTGAKLAPFGFETPEIVAAIADCARQIDAPEEVWCAAGSGTLARGLMSAWPEAKFFLVQVGRLLPLDLIRRGVQLIDYPLPFSKECTTPTPFPSDRHYDAKAWEACMKWHQRGGNVLFWNVVGPANPAA